MTVQDAHTMPLLAFFVFAEIANWYILSSGKWIFLNVTLLGTWVQFKKPWNIQHDIQQAWSECTLCIQHNTPNANKKKLPLKLTQPSLQMIDHVLALLPSSSTCHVINISVVTEKFHEIKICNPLVTDVTHMNVCLPSWEVYKHHCAKNTLKYNGINRPPFPYTSFIKITVVIGLLTSTGQTACLWPIKCNSSQTGKTLSCTDKGI
jgi:hypothetical protein